MMMPSRSTLPVRLILIRIPITGTGRGRIALVVENHIVRGRRAFHATAIPLIQVQVHAPLLLLLLLVHLLLMGQVRTAAYIVRAA